MTPVYSCYHSFRERWSDLWVNLVRSRVSQCPCAIITAPPAVLQKGEDIAQLGRVGLWFDWQCDSGTSPWTTTPVPGTLAWRLWCPGQSLPRSRLAVHLLKKWGGRAHLPLTHLRWPQPVLGRKQKGWLVCVVEPWSSASSIGESGLRDPQGKVDTPAFISTHWRCTDHSNRPRPLET